MSYLRFLNFTLLPFVEAFIVILMYTILNNKKDFVIRNKGKTLAFCIFYTVFAYWASIGQPAGLHAILIFAFFSICLGFLVNVNFVASFISSIALSICFMVVEFISSVPFMIFLKQDINDIVNYPFMRLNLYITCKILEILVILIILKTEFTLDLNTFRKENSFPSSILIQIFILGFIIVSTNYVGFNPDSLILYDVLMSIIYIICIILCYMDFKERENYLKLKSKYSLQ